MRCVDWGGVGGLAFVALTLVNFFALLNTLDSHKRRYEFASYYGHFRGSSHEWGELLGTVTASLAAFSLVWFLRRLRELLRPADEGLGALAFAGGFLFLALYLAAVVASTAVGTTLAYTDDFRADLDTAILLSDVALFLITAAAAAFQPLEPVSDTFKVSDTSTGEKPTLGLEPRTPSLRAMRKGYGKSRRCHLQVLLPCPWVSMGQRWAMISARILPASRCCNEGLGYRVSQRLPKGVAHGNGPHSHGLQERGVDQRG
jgi:hypothetical protein